jgi:hypothetical protein
VCAVGSDIHLEGNGLAVLREIILSLKGALVTGHIHNRSPVPVSAFPYRTARHHRI